MVISPFNDGDLVVLSPRYGRISVRVNREDDVRKDYLRMTRGCEEANVDEPTGVEHLNSVSGFPGLLGLRARAEKEKDGFQPRIRHLR